MEYTATFFNHFGAVRFRKKCLEKGWKAALAPVPRALSSSCGTCVIYSGGGESSGLLPQEAVPDDLKSDELEQVVTWDADGSRYISLFRADQI